jgi:hypothetical protein
MNYSFSSAWNEFAHLAGRLDQQTWLVVCAIAMIVGYFCLRGFGSRNNY